MAQVKDLVQSEGKNVVLCPFSFAPNGSSAVSQASIIGPAVQSVTRTGVGVFQVKFNEKYAVYICGFAHFSLSAFADTQVQLSGFTAATSSAPASINVLVETAGVAADIAANAANRIMGLMIFSRNEKIA